MSCLSSFVKKKPTVSVIVLEGEIGRKKALSLKKTKKMINKAFEKPNLVAVAMVINSGGGSPVQSQLIASYLLDRYFLCILVLMSSLDKSSSRASLTVRITFPEVRSRKGTESGLDDDDFSKLMRTRMQRKNLSRR